MDDDLDDITEIDEIVSGALISFTSFGLQRICLVLLAYFISTIVSPSMYGFISVLTQVQGYVVRFIGGVNTGLFRTLPRHNKTIQNAIITAVIPILFGLWSLVFITIYVFREQIINATLLIPEHMSTLFVFAITMLPVIFLSFIAGVLRVYKSMTLSHLLWTVGKPFLFLVTSVILVGGSLFSLVNFWVGVLLSSSFFVFLGFLFLYRYEEFHITSPFTAKDVLKDFIEYSGYASVSTVFRLLQASGILFIAVYLSPITAGVIGVAMVLGDINRWPLKSINQIFPQIATEIYDDDRITLLNNLYKITSLTIMLFSIPIFAFYLLFDSMIMGFFSQSYIPYSHTVVVISFGELIASIFGSVGLLLMMTDNERPTLIMQIFLSILIVPLFFYLTINFGVTGVAVAFFLAATINNVVELAVLWYLEGLFPFTKQHLFLTLLSLSIISILYGAFEYIILAVQVQLILFIISILIYFIITTKFILSEQDMKFLNSVKSQLLSTN